MSTEPQFLLASGYADAEAPGIYGFYLLESGELVPNGSWAGLPNPSFITLHPSGTLYATAEIGDGTVAALRLGRRPGEVEQLGQQPSGGQWPCHLAFDPAGKLLAVANYGSGTARLIPRNSDGTLGEPGPVARHSGMGPNAGRQEGPHAHSTIFSPDGRYAIVADLGTDRLMVYAAGEGGALEPRGEGVARPGAGPRHMAWHPGGRLLYVANELDNTVSAFSFDPATGALSETQHLSTIPADSPHSQVADIHLDAAGERLYVSNRGHNSIAVFTVAFDGGLSLLAIKPCGGDWPRNFAISPDGRFLVVANQNSGTLDVLPVIDGPEALGAPVAQAALPKASCVVFPAGGTIGWDL
jgi:6-phosphogluconolactonase